VKKIFFCLLILAVLPFAFSAYATLAPDKVRFHKEPDWAGIIHPGYKPHQDVFAKLVPGMTGEEAKRIIRSSANPFKERLEITGTPINVRVVWIWGNRFSEAEGDAMEMSQLAVTIEDCQVTIVTVEFVGVYPNRTFQEGRSKVLGIEEGRPGANSDKMK